MKTIINTSSSLSWLLSMVKNSKKGILFLTILQSITALLTTLYPIITLKVINSVESRDYNQFVKALTLFVIFIIVQLIIWYFLSLYSEHIYFTVKNSLQIFCVTTWLKRKTIYEYHLKPGELMNILSSDIRTITDGCISIIPRLLSIIVRLVVTIVLLYLLLPIMAYIMILGGIVMFFATILIRKKIKKLHKEVNKRGGYVKSYFQEVFQNPILIRSFGVENNIINNINKLIHSHRKIFRKRVWFLTTSQLIISISFSTAIIIGTTIASIQIMDYKLAIGVYIAVGQLIGQLREPLVSLSGFITKYFTMIASVERLIEVNPNMILSDTKFVSSEKRLDTPKKIIFNNVDFSYTDDENLSLKKFNLEIKQGQHTGIIGDSGGGKSTFLKILIGVYQHHMGEIKLTYDNYTNILTDENIIEYRNLFAYVPQANDMMSGTVRDLVAFSDIDSSNDDKRIKNALKIACALDFVEKLPNGLDTVIKEAGEGVSGGQMQRLAIARAIFSNRPFLVLDEATSALDNKTEEELLFNLKNMTCQTIILVTHRQKTLTICDRVIEFNN